MQKYYAKAIEKWGEDAQYDQLIEEMAELTIAVNKLKRLKYDIAPGKKEQIINNLFEEICDVKLMLNQMEYMFGKENIDKRFEEKFNKFLEELES